MLTLKGDNYKMLNNEIQLIIKEIENRVKKERCILEIMKK